MDCPNCKREVVPKSQFCNHCGARLPASDDQSRDREPKSRPPRNQRKPKQKKQPPRKPSAPIKTQYSLFVVFIVIFLAVIVVGMIILIPRGESGYEAETASENVSDRDGETRSGTLELASVPEGASVYVNDSLRGHTPFKEDMLPGTYSVSVQLPDFQKETVIIDIEAGARVVRTVELKPVYILDIPANPADAVIKVDGTFQGKTPGTIEWPNPSCELVIEKEGWSTYRERLELTPGTNRIDYRLDKAIVILDIATDPPDAQVYLNDRLVGRTPFRDEVSPGDFTLRLQKDGYRTVERRLDLRANSELNIPLEVAETINIKISASPWAEVFIDGASIGNVPPIKEISITVGPHTFEFVRGDSQITKKYEVKPIQNLHLHMNMDSGEMREIK